MKKAIAISFLALGSILASAQTKKYILPEYQFTTVKANPVTPVKNQHRSGTCWAYSSMAFLESEAIRLCGIKDSLKYPDFSEFYAISHAYYERGVKYVRLDGCMRYAAGSESDDILDVTRDHGLVPQSAMSGMNYGTDLPVQAELDAVLKAYLGAIVRNPNKTLTTAWKNGFRGILDAYFGKRPETFTVDGVEYTPESYRDAMKIVPADYVTITSFTHHPFYTSFALELADNWRGDLSWNVPIDELMETVDYAINNGYTIEWAADVSHPGFDRNGLGVLLDVENSETEGSDEAKWTGAAKPQSNKITVVRECVPTQESRQVEFDNKTLTDDHGLQIYGIAKDQDGNKFYIVKNSWGTAHKYGGIWYVSEAFVKGQTISITVHKTAVPKSVAKKLK